MHGVLQFPDALVKQVCKIWQAVHVVSLLSRMLPCLLHASKLQGSSFVHRILIRLEHDRFARNEVNSNCEPIISSSLETQWKVRSENEKKCAKLCFKCIHLSVFLWEKKLWIENYRFPFGLWRRCLNETLSLLSPTCLCSLSCLTGKTNGETKLKILNLSTLSWFWMASVLSEDLCWLSVGFCVRLSAFLQYFIWVWRIELRSNIHIDYLFCTNLKYANAFILQFNRHGRFWRYLPRSGWRGVSYTWGDLCHACSWTCRCQRSRKHHSVSLTCIQFEQGRNRCDTRLVDVFFPYKISSCITNPDTLVAN